MNFDANRFRTKIKIIYVTYFPKPKKVPIIFVQTHIEYLANITFTIKNKGQDYANML